MPGLPLKQLVGNRNPLLGFVGGAVLLAVVATAVTRPQWASPSTRYPSADTCASCHPLVVAQWKNSPHARAASSPNVDADVCTGCHAPVASLFGASVNPLSGLPRSLPDSAYEGVTCVVCHAGTHPTGDQVIRIRPMGENTVEPLFEIPGFEVAIGPFGSGVADDPLPVTNDSHDSELDAALSRSDFCQACHDVVLDKSMVSRRTGRTETTAHISTTHDEWSASDYVQRGETCQSCHMPGSDGPSPVTVQPDGVMYDRALPPRRISDHSMPGVGIAFWDNGPSVEQQQKAVTSLLATAAEVRIRAPAAVSAGEDVTIAVEIENTGAGHDLPTGLPFGHDAWLEVVVRDAQGRHLFTSGHRDAEGWVYDELNPSVRQDPDLYDPYLVNLRARMVRVDGGVDARLQPDGTAAIPPAVVDPLRNRNGTPILSTEDYDATPILTAMTTRDEGASHPQATLREVFMMYYADAVLQNGVAALGNRVAEYTFQVDDDARTPLDVTARLLMRQMHPYAMAVAQGLPHFVPRMPIYEVDGEEAVVTVRR